MPLYSKKRINNGIVALWHITEDFDDLLSLIPGNWIDGVDLSRLSTHNLAARTLAHTVCPEFDILEKDEYGKPYFESAQHKISITHSGHFAGFMLKEDSDCGMDMEHINPRILKLAPKFIRHDEQEFADAGINGLYLVWCAKEALYKYYGLKALDFKDHLKVHFEPLSTTGTIRGVIHKNDYYQEVQLSYWFEQDYLIVHTL